MEPYPVVRLRFSNAATFGPVILLAISCWGEFLKFSRPEPTVDFIRKQIGAVTSLEVTQTTRCPDIFDLEINIKIW